MALERLIDARGRNGGRTPLSVSDRLLPAETAAGGIDSEQFTRAFAAARDIDGPVHRGRRRVHRLIWPRNLHRPQLALP